MDTFGFADIVGPIMVGPSSSHTAGALRIARMARSLLAAAPVRAEFTLYGSFAHTQSGHGTDKALIAGLLGLEPDDLGVRDSFERAHAAGLAFSFCCDREAAVEHPNTVDARIVDAEGGALEVRGVSVGGGAAVVTRIDGIDVNVTGEHTSVVVRQRDETGVLAHIAGCFSDCAVNIATARMYRTRRGSEAFTVMELDGPAPAEAKAAIERHPAVRDVRIVPADGAAGRAAGDAAGRPAGGTGACATAGAEQAEERFAACDFASGAELLARCTEQGAGLAGAFLAREQALAALDGRACDALPYADRVLAVMRASATEPLREPVPSMGGLIGGEARDVRRSREQGPAVVDGLAGAAMEYALAVLETNASMGRIVAAPTAGSAGVRARRATGPGAGARPRRRRAAPRAAGRRCRGVPHSPQRHGVGRRRRLPGGDRRSRRHGRRGRRGDGGRHAGAGSRCGRERALLAAWGWCATRWAASWRCPARSATPPPRPWRS